MNTPQQSSAPATTNGKTVAPATDLRIVEMAASILKMKLEDCPVDMKRETAIETFKAELIRQGFLTPQGVEVPRAAESTNGKAAVPAAPAKSPRPDPGHAPYKILEIGCRALGIYFANWKGDLLACDKMLREKTGSPAYPARIDWSKARQASNSSATPRKESPYFNTPLKDVKCVLSGRSIDIAGHAYVPKYPALQDAEDKYGKATADALRDRLFTKVMRKKGDTQEPFYEGKFFSFDAMISVAKEVPCLVVKEMRGGREVEIVMWWKLFSRYSAVIERRKNASRARVAGKAREFFSGIKFEEIRPEDVADLVVSDGKDGGRKFSTASKPTTILGDNKTLSALHKDGTRRERRQQRREKGGPNAARTRRLVADAEAAE